MRCKCRILISDEIGVYGMCELNTGHEGKHMVNYDRYYNAVLFWDQTIEDSNNDRRNRIVRKLYRKQFMIIENNRRREWYRKLISRLAPEDINYYNERYKEDDILYTKVKEEGK